MAVFMGTTSAVLCSLFGQLQRGALTSSPEVNPDTLVRGSATVWVNSATLGDFLTDLLNVMQMLVPRGFNSGLFQIDCYPGNHRGSSFISPPTQRFLLLDSREVMQNIQVLLLFLSQLNINC